MTLFLTNKTTIVFLLTIILSNVFESEAQNARMNSLSNNFLLDDFSSVTSSPSSCSSYPDAFQATAYQDGSFGPVIGLKSLGKYFTFGFIANQEDYITSEFYKNAKSFLDSSIDTISKLSTHFPHYPHPVFSIQLPTINIGCQLYYERSSLSSSYTTSEGYSEIVKKDIMDYGVFLNASIHLKALNLYPFVGYSIPNAQGMANYKDGIDTSISVQTSGNSVFEYGLEISIPIQNFDIHIGGNTTSEQFTITNHIDSLNNYHQNVSTFYNLYAGLIWSDSLLTLSAVYSFSYDEIKSTIHDQPSTTFENQKDKCHSLIGSCEYTIPLRYVLDNITIRAGINWYSLFTTTVYKSDSSDHHDNGSEDYPPDVSSFTPTIGLGFTKGIFSFDISSKLSDWSGVTSGMPVLTGTLTCNFSKKS